MGDHRQPVQPRQQEHPGLAGRSSPHPARLHPQARLLAEHAGRLVADLPAPGTGRTGLRRPRRDRPRHPGGHRPAQRPRPALDLGTAPAQAPLLPPTFYIHLLRNVALIVNGMAGPEMSDTGLTVPGMTEPSRRYDVTITVDSDGRHHSNPAEFAVAAEQAASARSASIV